MKITFRLNPEIVKQAGVKVAPPPPPAPPKTSANKQQAPMAQMPDDFLPARQAALRELESPDMKKIHDNVSKKLGWDHRAYRDNAMQLMQEIQTEIDKYGSVRSDNFLPDAMKRGDYLDTTDWNDDVDMNGINDTAYEWGKAVLAAYKRNVRGTTRTSPPNPQ